MNNDEFAQLAKSRGYRVYHRGDRVQLAPCPHCGNDPGNHGNWSANADIGKYNAWCCSDSGRLENFVQDHLGQENVHIPVQDEDNRHTQRPSTQDLQLSSQDLIPATEMDSTYHYLRKRGVSTDQIFRYRISACTRENHPQHGESLHGRIVVPLHTYWGELFGHVARTITGDKPKYIGLYDETRIAGFRARGQPGVHIVTEGVFDGLAVERAGFQAAVLLGQIKDNLRFWADALPREDVIGLAMDGSSTYVAERAQKRLSEFRDNVRVVEIPEGEDPASVGDEKLKTLIENVL